MKEKCVITTITPSGAEKLLRGNERNRRLTGSRVTKLTRTIRGKRWVLNGASIIVDSKGRLVDGQHRLHAVVRSNQSIQTVLVTGVSPKAFETIDQGAKRSGADVFGIYGVDHPGLVSTAIGLIWQDRNGVHEGSEGSGRIPDMDEKITLFDKLPGIERLVTETAQYKKALHGILSVGVLAGMNYIFHGKHTQAAETFQKLFAIGEGSLACPPVLLHRKFKLLSEEDYSISRQAQCAYLKLGWNLFVAGERATDIELQETLDIPINKLTSRHWLN